LLRVCSPIKPNYELTCEFSTLKRGRTESTRCSADNSPPPIGPPTPADANTSVFSTNYGHRVGLSDGPTTISVNNHTCSTQKLFHLMLLLTNSSANEQDPHTTNRTARRALPPTYQSYPRDRGRTHLWTQIYFTKLLYLQLINHNIQENFNTKFNEFTILQGCNRHDVREKI